MITFVRPKQRAGKESEHMNNIIHAGGFSQIIMARHLPREQVLFLNVMGLKNPAEQVSHVRWGLAEPVTVVCLPGGHWL